MDCTSSCRRDQSVNNPQEGAFLEGLQTVPGIDLIPKTTQEPVRETRSYHRVNSNGQLDWIECARICRGDVALDVFDQAVAGILKWCTECGIQSRVVTLAAKTMSFAFAKEAHVEVRSVQAEGQSWITQAKIMLAGTFVTRYLRLYEDEKPVSRHIRRRYVFRLVFGFVQCVAFRSMRIASTANV